MGNNKYIGQLDLSSKAISKLPLLSSIGKDGRFEVEKVDDVQYFFINLEPSAINNDKYISLRYDNSDEHLLYSESISSIISTDHQSMSFTYAELSAQLLDDIKNSLNVGSMFYKEEYQYSRINHQHDYSIFTVQPGVKASDLSQYYEEGVDPKNYKEYVGTFITQQLSGDRFIDISTDLFVPYIKVVDYSNANIGELRFIARPNFVPTNVSLSGSNAIYDSDTSSYWVYPRGQTISCNINEFEEACKIFGNDSRDGYDTSFTIPLISNFIKLNPNAYSLSANRIVEHQTGLISHTHQITYKESSSTIPLTVKNVQISANNSGGSGIGNTIHTGGPAGTGNTFSKLTEVSCDLNSANLIIRNGYTEYAGESINPECYPNYNDLPVILYIGMR